MSRFWESTDFDAARASGRRYGSEAGLRWAAWPGGQSVGPALAIAAKVAQAGQPRVDAVAQIVEESVKRASRPGIVRP